MQTFGQRLWSTCHPLVHASILPTIARRDALESLQQQSGRQIALAGALDGGLCVQFFGEATWSCVKLGSTLPLTKGVELGLFHKVKRPAFKKAIEDTIAYLQVGPNKNQRTLLI